MSRAVHVRKRKRSRVTLPASRRRKKGFMVKAMKQKYSITVADMDLNIISDASPDEVENIVGMLDRRMRDINLKSPRCTKNEAAILCALSYCSERIAMQEAFKKVEKDAFRFAGENEKLKKTIEGLQEEIDHLRKDADVMRSILDRAALTATPQPSAQAEKPKYVPKPFKKQEEPTINREPSTEEEPIAPVIPVQQPTGTVPAAAAVDAPASAPSEDKKASKGKSHIGNMFDLLTFSDV